MRKRNPRYLVTTGEGDELGIFPAFNAVEAVKRARSLYPGRKKLSAKKVDERMYIGNDRAKALEDKERLARKLSRASAKKKNPLNYQEANELYHRLNNEGQGFAIGEDHDDIATASAASGWHVLERYVASLLLAQDPAGRMFLVGGDGAGQGAWAVSLANHIQNPRRQLARAVTRGAVARGAVSPRRRNKTYIHADNIDHLDVAKVHNPMLSTAEDVWEAISDEPIISSSRSAPEGNYSWGLILEEYQLSDGTFLQVAFDPRIGNQPVEWHHSATSADSWMVG